MSDFSILVINTIGLILILGVLAGYIAEKYKLPKMVPLLLIGIGISFLSPEGLIDFGNESFKDVTLAIAELGLLLVLYQEGMHISLKHLKLNILPIILLASIGTILTATLVGITTSLLIVTITTQQFHYIILGNLLLASIVVPTDPAATFSILRQSGQRVKKHLETILGGESAFNDVIAILLVITIFLPQVEKGNTSLEFSFMVILVAIWQLIGGIALGTIISIITLLFIRTFGKSNEVTSLTLGSVLSIFTLAQLINVSGAIAALSAGIIIKNPHYVKMRRWYSDSFFAPFWDKLIFLIEIFAFTFIGSLFNFDRFSTYIRIGLILSFIVIGARIAAVYIVTVPLERREKTKSLLSHRDRLFIAFAGFKGLTTAVLALISYVTLANKEVEVSDNQPLFSDVILYGSISLILVSGIIQGLLLPTISTRMQVYEYDTGDIVETAH